MSWLFCTYSCDSTLSYIKYAQHECVHTQITFIQTHYGVTGSALAPQNVTALRSKRDIGGTTWPSAASTVNVFCCCGWHAVKVGRELGHGLWDVLQRVVQVRTIMLSTNVVDCCGPGRPTSGAAWVGLPIGICLAASGICLAASQPAAGATTVLGNPRIQCLLVASYRCNQSLSQSIDQSVGTVCVAFSRMSCKFVAASWLISCC